MFTIIFTDVNVKEKSEIDELSEQTSDTRAFALLRDTFDQWPAGRSDRLPVQTARTLRTLQRQGRRATVHLYSSASILTHIYKLNIHVRVSLYYSALFSFSLSLPPSLTRSLPSKSTLRENAHKCISHAYVYSLLTRRTNCLYLIIP